MMNKIVARCKNATLNSSYDDGQDPITLAQPTNALSKDKAVLRFAMKYLFWMPLVTEEEISVISTTKNMGGETNS